jgi:hypothetical protein
LFNEVFPPMSALSTIISFLVFAEPTTSHNGCYSLDGPVRWGYFRSLWDEVVNLRLCSTARRHGVKYLEQFSNIQNTPISNQ